MLINLFLIILGGMLSPTRAVPTPPSFTNQSVTLTNSLAVPTTPLFILQSAPSFYRPSFWLCPYAKVKFGGGQTPWSLYYVNLTSLSLNPEEPLLSSVGTILLHTRNSGTVRHSNSQDFPVGSNLSFLVVDGRNNMAMTDSGPLEQPSFDWWEGTGDCMPLLYPVVAIPAYFIMGVVALFLTLLAAVLISAVGEELRGCCGVRREETETGPSAAPSHPNYGTTARAYNITIHPDLTHSISSQSTIT